MLLRERRIRDLLVVAEHDAGGALEVPRGPEELRVRRPTPRRSPYCFMCRGKVSESRITGGSSAAIQRDVAEGERRLVAGRRVGTLGRRQERRSERDGRRHAGWEQRVGEPPGGVGVAPLGDEAKPFSGGEVDDALLRRMDGDQAGAWVRPALFSRYVPTS